MTWPRGLVLAVGVTLVVAWAGGCAPEVTFGPAGEPEEPPSARWLAFAIETVPAHEKVARLLAGQLAEIGVRAGVEVKAWREVVARARRGEADAVVLGWAGAAVDPLLLAARLDPRGAESFSGYPAGEIGRLLAGLRTRPEAEDQARLARAAQEILHEDVPWVFGFAYPLFDAASSRLAGWVPGPGGAVGLDDLRLAREEGGPGSPAARVTVAVGIGERLSLDPFGPPDPQVATVLRCLFESLVELSRDGTLVPVLAEGWELSPSGKRLTVTLREDVVFHTGHPLRPSDVVFSYRKALEGRLPSGLEVSVQASGPRTVVFRFSVPFPDFLELFGRVPVVPAAYYQAVGPEEFSRRPVGTGPYRLDPERGGRQFVLERWDGHRSGSVEGGVEEVVFLFVHEPERRLAMLKSGQADLVPALDPAQAAVARGLPGVVVEQEPGWAFVHLELNNRRAPFDHAGVRLALNLAVDREALLEVLGPGAVALATAFHPEAAGFCPDTGAFPRDLAGARELLREAGFLVLEPRE
ncbi:MAG: hypothetical protein K6U08_01855 [Firmicutes bacterium]|nr:hypothetical protein [Bacillota bacterium]